MLAQPDLGPASAASASMRSYGTTDKSTERDGGNNESTSDPGIPTITSKPRRTARRFGIMAISAAAVVAGAIYWQTSGSVTSSQAAGSTTTQLAGSPTPAAPSVPQSGEQGSNFLTANEGREDGKSMLWSIFGNLPVWATSARRGGHAASETCPELDYTVTNFYHQRDGRPGAQIPWLDGIKLAEPYRDTSLRVLNPRKGHNYSWEVRNIDDSEHVLARATGAEVVISFTELDLNVISLTEARETSGQVVREKTDTVMVKYVRREIRTLTDEEREELLDAVSVGRGKSWMIHL